MNQDWSWNSSARPQAWMRAWQASQCCHRTLGHCSPQQAACQAC